VTSDFVVVYRKRKGVQFAFLDSSPLEAFQPHGSPRSNFLHAKMCAMISDRSQIWFKGVASCSPLT